MCVHLSEQIVQEQCSGAQDLSEAWNDVEGLLGGAVVEVHCWGVLIFLCLHTLSPGAPASAKQSRI